MFWLKACPRCRTGDMELVKDACGYCKHCMQCGHYVFPSVEDEELPVSGTKSKRVSSGGLRVNRNRDEG